MNSSSRIVWSVYVFLQYYYVCLFFDWFLRTVLSFGFWFKKKKTLETIWNEKKKLNNNHGIKNRFGRVSGYVRHVSGALPHAEAFLRSASFATARPPRRWTVRIGKRSPAVTLLLWREATLRLRAEAQFLRGVFRAAKTRHGHRTVSAAQFPLARGRVIFVVPVRSAYFAGTTGARGSINIGMSGTIFQSSFTVNTKMSNAKNTISIKWVFFWLFY